MAFSTRQLSPEEIVEAMKNAGLQDAKLLGTKRDHAAGTVTIHTDKGSVSIHPPRK